MRIAAVLLATIATTATLTACGGSGGTANDVDYTSASSIAQALDKGGYECTGFEPNTEVMGAREDGACTHGGATITVTTFNDADQMKAITDAVSAIAGGVNVQGDKWQVNVPDGDQAEQVQKILGGDIK